MRNWMFRAVCGLVMSSAAVMLGVTTDTARVVTSITFSGAVAVPDTALATSLASRVGLPYTLRRVNADIHALMKLRRFDNVCVTANTNGGRVALNYQVHLVPQIKDVVVVTEDRALPLPRGTIRSRAGRRFSPVTMYDDRLRTLRYLHQRNYHAAIVVANTVDVPGTNTVVVVFAISEGVPQHVERIDVEGNAAIGAWTIQGLLHCRERNRWLFRRGMFDEDLLFEDEARIRNFYLDRGYLDAQVAVVVEEGSAKDAVRIVVRIVEGPVYRIGRVIWHQSLATDDNADLLYAAISVNTGDAWDSGMPMRIGQEVERYCAQHGLPQPSVTVKAFMNADSYPAVPLIDVSIVAGKQGRYAPDGRPQVAYPFAESLVF